MMLPSIPPIPVSVSAKADGTGRTVGEKIRSQSFPLSRSSRLRKRLCFFGDSLTGQAPTRAPNIYDGRIWWNCTVVTTNLGAGSWVGTCLIDGKMPSATGGTLQTDGTGKLQWKSTGDTDFGPLVDVTNGGWYLLQSATSAYPILVAVRGATTPPASPGTGAVTQTATARIADYDLASFPSFVAGRLGDTFVDYQFYGIPGATSADVLKHLPGTLQYDMEAAVLLIGVNDNPGSATAAATVIANIKAIVALLQAKSRRVYVLDIFPNESAGGTVASYNSFVSDAVGDWCEQQEGIVFVSSFNTMWSPQAVAIGGRTGVFRTDKLHLMPFGGNLVATQLVAAITRDYPLTLRRRRHAPNDAYNTTLQVGSWNLNPTMRGTAGTVVSSKGVTGTAPDSWIIDRSGSTQTCTTSFVADDQVPPGLDWFTLSIAGATAGDYHKIDNSSTVSIPSGVSAGDYFRVLIEVRIGACTGNGLSTLQFQVNGNGNAQNAYPVTATQNVATFGTELPVLNFKSEPQKLLAGTTSLVLEARIGGADASATAVIGIRDFRIEKCAAPSTLTT